MTGAPSCRRLRSLRPARRSATPPRRRSSAGISRRRAWRRCRRADHATACHPRTPGTGAEARASASRSGRFPRSSRPPPGPPAGTAAAPHQAGRSPCHAAAGPAESGNDPEKQSFRPEHPPRPSCHLVTKSVAVDGFRTLPRCHALFHPIALMRSDIELALGILMEYQRRGKPLRLIEDFQINEETGEVRVLMPEWQTSLISEFRSLFDEDEARYRFMKTYNELIGKRMTGPGLN